MHAVCHRVVGDDGVHMDHGLAVKFFVQLMLCHVDEIMHFQYIAVAGHLCMQRDHTPARAVIVYDQIMDANDLLMGQHGLLYFVDKILIRRLAQKRL